MWESTHTTSLEPLTQFVKRRRTVQASPQFQRCLINTAMEHIAITKCSIKYTIHHNTLYKKYVERADIKLVVYDLISTQNPRTRNYHWIFTHWTCFIECIEVSRSLSFWARDVFSTRRPRHCLCQHGPWKHKPKQCHSVQKKSKTLVSKQCYNHLCHIITESSLTGLLSQEKWFGLDSAPGSWSWSVPRICRQPQLGHHLGKANTCGQDFEPLHSLHMLPSRWDLLHSTTIHKG